MRLIYIQRERERERERERGPKLAGDVHTRSRVAQMVERPGSVGCVEDSSHAVARKL